MPTISKHATTNIAKCSYNHSTLHNNQDYFIQKIQYYLKNTPLVLTIYSYIIQFFSLQYWHNYFTNIELFIFTLNK